MKLLLNPIIFSLFLALSIVVGAIFMYAIGNRRSKSNLSIVEKSFTFVFFTLLLMGNRAFIGNLSAYYLGSHAVNRNASLYALVQLTIYALVLFLLRSRVHYLFQGIIFLLRDPFLVGLLVLTVLSSFWSGTPLDTFKASLVLLGLSLYASFVAVRCNFQELTQYLRGFGAWLAIASVVVEIFLPSIAENSKGGWQGITAHPNTLGPAMALNVVLCCLNAVDRPKQRWSSISLAILSFVVMLLTNSSSTKVVFVALIGSAMVLRLLKHLDFRQASAAFMFLLMLGILGHMAIVSNTTAIFDLLGRDKNLTGRGEFWPAIIEAIDRRLLFGYGYQGFWQSWRGTENPAAHITAQNFTPTHSHNGFLELALALGLVGIILFALSFVRNILHVFWLGYFNKLYEAEILILLVSYVIFSNLTEPGLWEIGCHPFLYIFLSVRNGMEIAQGNFSTKNLERSPY
jgi:exopolysaccharide production protein ExoQ